jgi:hypothetical protein
MPETDQAPTAAVDQYDPELTQLQRDYPSWSIHRSRATAGECRSYFATPRRRGLYASHSWPYGGTLCADTLAELRALLDHQSGDAAS